MHFVFSYPQAMTGDKVWVSNTILGTDGISCATPLAEPAKTNLIDAVTGLIPGCIGETSVIAIAIGAIFLIATNVASWKTMLSVFIGGLWLHSFTTMFVQIQMQLLKFHGTNIFVWVASVLVLCSWLQILLHRPALRQESTFMDFFDRCYRHYCTSVGWICRRYDAGYSGYEYVCAINRFLCG